MWVSFCECVHICVCSRLIRKPEHTPAVATQWAITHILYIHTFKNLTLNSYNEPQTQWRVYALCKCVHELLCTVKGWTENQRQKKVVSYVFGKNIFFPSLFSVWCSITHLTSGSFKVRLILETGRRSTNNKSKFIEKGCSLTGSHKTLKNKTQ